MKNKTQILLTLLFAGYLAWWASFQHIVTGQGVSVQRFGATYGVMALAGAVIGFIAARKWGGFKTVLGKALTFFSLGLLAQEAGQIIYTYYIYGAKIQIPYPSWGDLAYFGSVLLYITAAFFLSRAAGTRFSLKDTKYKAVAVVVPAALLATSYWVLLHNHQYDTSHPLTVFLDFGYPMGQAIYISIAITAYLLSRKLLGGVMRQGIVLIILGLFVQYVADFMFIYQSNRGTWLTGKLDDLLYLVAYFVMASALLKFYRIYKGLSTASTHPAQNNPEPPPSPSDDESGA
jgi:hypothetical protein